MVQKKMAKTYISFNKLKGNLHSSNKINPRGKTAGKFWYDLLKSIFVKVKLIRISYNHAVFSWVYMNCKYFLAVETDGILVATHNMIFSGRLMNYFYTLFGYTL